jgi:putative N-acetylmannosamine-6-phosphate epimerase
VFAIAAGWIAGLVAQVVPGAHLDQSQIVAFMAAAAASALAAGWKWLQGWQQHEALVARGLDVPVKQGQSPQAVLAAGTSSASSASPPSSVGH